MPDMSADAFHKAMIWVYVRAKAAAKYNATS
jgi:hypothetical protein